MKRKHVKNVFIVLFIIGALIVLTLQDNRIETLETSNRENLKIAQREYEGRIKAEKQVETFTELAKTVQENNNKLREEITNLKKERDEARRASRSRRVADADLRATSGTVASGSGSSTRASLGTKSITGYCATGNRTASGKIPRPGMVATLDRRIKFGTRVRIDGVGVFTVEDRIGHSSDFDIFFGSCAEARQFGRKRLRVEILG